jgi:nucleotide-binding universal stress UspA family protein
LNIARPAYCVAFHVLNSGDLRAIDMHSDVLQQGRIDLTRRSIGRRVLESEAAPMQTPATDTMPSFQRVLVATDFSAASQAAYRTALETCVSLGASLLVLHAFEYGEMATPESGGLLLEMQGLRESCKENLEELCRESSRSGVKCETVMEDGNASDCILKTLEEKEIDLAILGTNALHGFERLIFGSTAETVLRKAPCPVLTVGPRGANCLKDGQANAPVIFATDFDFTTMHAIRFAAYFSNLTATPLHCVHVLPRTLEGGPQGQIVPAIMSEALHQLANESGVVIEAPTCATIFGSEISYAVVDYARQQKAKLIVLGVRQASLLASHVPEHITYRIITEASCPVLTMAFDSHARTADAAAQPCAKQASHKHLAV